MTDSTPVNDPWVIYGYERDMVLALCSHVPTPETVKEFEALPWEFQNATIECLVLHTRVLTDILISKASHSDDITLTKLLPALKSPNVAALQSAYGAANIPNSPCWQFNKLMAHATAHRTDSHEYLPALKAVLPTIGRLVDEIEAARLATKS
jgi:hypothetical protein